MRNVCPSLPNGSPPGEAHGQRTLQAAHKFVRTSCMPTLGATGAPFVAGVNVLIYTAWRALQDGGDVALAARFWEETERQLAEAVATLPAPLNLQLNAQ